MLPGGSVNTCVTSPPYFGLRDYGHADQIGLEETPEQYVAKMVEVFREVRRVLRDDGTLWLNLGDSYAGSGRGGTTPTSTLQGSGETQDKSRVVVGETAREAAVTKRAGESRIPRGSALPAGLHESVRQGGAIGRAWVPPPPPPGLKQKDLIGIPWLVALALRADGWYLRQDIIWHKPNPMPESVRDRCTKAHEYIFMLSKSDRYFYDNDAIAEPVAASTIERLAQPNLANQHGSDRVPGKTNGPMKAVAKKQDGHGRRHAGFNDRYFGRKDQTTHVGRPQQSGFAAMTTHGDGGYQTRNRRSVWTVTTKPFKGAHFATFPPDLIEPCILAGSPTGGLVLDPFGGAGTTGLVAQRYGRNAILCELNPEYAAMAEARIIADRKKNLEALL